MSTPEGKIKDKVKAALKEFSAYYHMPVQNGMGKPTLDFICCHKGRFLGIEAKADKGHLTTRQQMTIDEMRAPGADGAALVVEGVKGVEMLRMWLQLNEFHGGQDWEEHHETNEEASG